MAAFLKKEFEQSGYRVQEIIENVISVENFLSKSELKELFDIINNASQEDWEIEYLGNLKAFCLNKFGRDDVDNLVKEGKFEITKNWADKNLNITELLEDSNKFYRRLDLIMKKANSDLEMRGLKTIQRMYDGVELKSHTDQYTDPSIQYAAIIYLNDDYVDGELFFVNKDIKLRPKPGTLLVFPGNEEFEHGVKHVGPGPMRYVIVGFIGVVDFYKDKKY